MGWGLASVVDKGIAESLTAVSSETLFLQIFGALQFLFRTARAYIRSFVNDLINYICIHSLLKISIPSLNAILSPFTVIMITLLLMIQQLNMVSIYKSY